MMNVDPRADLDAVAPNGRRPAPAGEPTSEPELDGSQAGSRGDRARSTGRPSRRRLKDWPVRSRLLLLIAVPTVAAIVFGGIRIAAAAQSALAFQRAEQRAVLASTIGQLAQRLEAERDQTIYYIAQGSNGRAGDLSSPPASGAVQQYQAIQAFYRQTDPVIGQFRARLGQFRGAYSGEGQQEVASALAEISSLPSLRQASTKTRLYPLAVVQKYAALIDSLIVLDNQTSQGTGDHVMSQTTEVLGLVSRMQEAASQQRAILSAALLQGTLNQAEAAALASAQDNQQSAQQAFNLAATVPQRRQWNDALSGAFVYLAASEEQRAAALQAHAHSLAGDPLTAAGFYDAMSGGINQMGSVERTLAESVVTRSNSLRGSAVAYAIVVGLAVFILLAVALTFTMLVGRSMVRPLRRLRAGALEVAGRQLPETVRRMSEGEGADAPLEVEPIDVDSTDEIGQVARAFDQVHREAVRLASNEAALRGTVNAMFVNLSRRSQSLVQRQIGLIDDLEQGEQDPERLGNLFQMDHLATRMRRNSENLLVLAGQDVSRRWTQAVGLVDVLRAVVSEIEQYERVTLNAQPGIAVRGQAVSDVVHLLSELVENATSFSAAGTPVEVDGHRLNAGGVLLAITDQGVGMGAEEMDHANWRLDRPPVVDVAASRRMGLFVVARLAARHGIRVRLRPASMGGLIALVWLPDEVIIHETAAAPALRRFDVTAPGVATATAILARMTEEPEPGRSEDPAAAYARAGSALGAEGLDEGAPDAAGAAASAWAAQAHEAPLPPDLPVSSAAAMAETGQGHVPRSDDVPFGREPSLERQSVEVPPTVSAEEANRLPIFESVESDWFRRGRHGDDAVLVASAGTWSSPADEGWRAAEVAHSPVSGGSTVAGLPRRVPKANLVPGGVGETSAAPAPARSAEQTRDRLASLQRGIREARAAADNNDQPDEHDGAT
jgi:signal transduction histidine kinase